MANTLSFPVTTNIAPITIQSFIFFLPNFRYRSIITFAVVSSMFHTYALIRPSIVFSNRIDCVIVSVLSSSVVDRGFEPRPCQTKDYKISICCFSAKHAALRRERAKTGWLRSRIMCPSRETCLSRLLFQSAITKKIQLGVSEL